MNKIFSLHLQEKEKIIKVKKNENKIKKANHKLNAPGMGEIFVVGN